MHISTGHFICLNDVESSILFLLPPTNQTNYQSLLQLITTAPLGNTVCGWQEGTNRHMLHIHRSTYRRNNPTHVHDGTGTRMLPWTPAVASCTLVASWSC